MGEEAEGDLRGVKRLFYTSGIHIDGMLALDSADPGRLFMGINRLQEIQIINSRTAPEVTAI